MSPLRVPSPFKTAEDPGEALLSASINLETPEIRVHEKAMSNDPVLPGPSCCQRKKRGERIPIRLEDLYLSAPNGSAKVKSCLVCLRKTVKRIVAYIDAVLPVGEEILGVSASGGVGGEGILDSRSSSPHPAVVKARFDEALAALRSLSSSVCVEAALDKDVMETYDELVLKLKALGLLDDEEEEEDSESEGEVDEVPEGYVLVSICNGLAGSGEGFLEMVAGVVADDQQEVEVSHCGAGF